MEYIALDFETANEYPGGACAIALVRFAGDGSVIDTFYSLIRPKIPYFHPGMTRVHQLESEACLAAPSFADLYEEIIDYIDGDLVVAHNAAFDLRVFEEALQAYDLYCDRLSYLCTLSLARKRWPGRISYSLPFLAKELSLTYRFHHALDDATVCGKLFYQLAQDHLTDRYTLERFLLQNQVAVKQLRRSQRAQSLFQ